MGEVLPFPDHAERVARLASRARDSGEAHTHNIRARNRAIVDAVDDKQPQNRVAQWANLKPSSITRILALPDYDELNDAA